MIDFLKFKKLQKRKKQLRTIALFELLVENIKDAKMRAEIEYVWEYISELIIKDKE